MKDFTLDEIKLIIRSVDLFQPIKDDFINNRYEQHNIKFDHYEPYYHSFYDLAMILEPDLTVELGTWQATAAAHFASGWSKGIVATIDHHSDPGDEENKKLTLEAVKQYDNLLYLQGWTWDRVDTIAGFGMKIDILFIDSWHQYGYAMKDWKLYSPLLASPALVICDDILKEDGPTIAGMDKFWNELPGEKFLDETLRKNIPMGFMKLE